MCCLLWVSLLSELIFSLSDVLGGMKRLLESAGTLQASDLLKAEDLKGFLFLPSSWFLLQDETLSPFCYLNVWSSWCTPADICILVCLCHRAVKSSLIASFRVDVSSSSLSWRSCWLCWQPGGGRVFGG